MAPNCSQSAKKDLVDQFCGITGADESIALQLLEACNNNVQMAINMHMEGIGGNSVQEDQVRAPILPRQEILVEEPNPHIYNFRGKRRAAKSIFDKFRDFHAEAKLQEQALLGTSGEASSSSGTRRVHFIGAKKRTLEDLFRPPFDIIFRGNFQAARDAGISHRKWLLVNVQDASEFQCQVLNRDVWSNTAIKSIVAEHFIFWQVYHDSVDGERFMQFYKVTEWPYVAILDPRTGESLVTWNRLDHLTFCDLVTEFLSSRPPIDPDESEVLNSAKRRKSDSLFEADEDAQLEAAIKASLVDQSDCKDDHDDQSDGRGEADSPLETFDSDSQDSIISLKSDLLRGEQIEGKESGGTIGNGTENGKEVEDRLGWKAYLGPASDENSSLVVRFPDGSRENIIMPCSSSLKALVLYVASCGYSNEQYELVANFPRRELSYMDLDATLKHLSLFPQDTIFVQKR